MTGWATRFTRGAEYVSAAFFALMFVAFMIQIISRYVFNHPVQWSLELCQLAYIWIVFWSAGFIRGERQHILFDLFYKKLRQGPRRLVGISNTAALALVFLVCLPATLEYVQFMGRRTTLILHIPLDLAYSCFALFMIAVIGGAVIRLKLLFGPRWREHL